MIEIIRLVKDLSLYLCMKLIEKYDETVVNNFIDPETAELIETSVEVKTHKIAVESKDQFAFIYASLIGALKGLNGGDIKLLMYCSMNCTLNSNMIPLNSHFLAEAAKQLDVSAGSLRNSIMSLTKKDILIKVGSGTYRVNPRYFWRGDVSERLKTMRYILEVECPTC
jgi:hypothetical protein